MNEWWRDELQKRHEAGLYRVLRVLPPGVLDLASNDYLSLSRHPAVLAAAQNAGVPGVVVGVGSEVPDRVDAERFRQKFNIRNLAAANKGAPAPSPQPAPRPKAAP